MQKKDIDVNFLNKDGFTPIMIAATRKIYEIVEFLLNDERIDINYKTIFFYLIYLIKMANAYY